nr:hypothetical protein [Candidatus Sigynarchaeota archaeon]
MSKIVKAHKNRICTHPRCPWYNHDFKRPKSKQLHDQSYHHAKRQYVRKKGTMSAIRAPSPLL